MLHVLSCRRLGLAVFSVLLIAISLSITMVPQSALAQSATVSANDNQPSTNAQSANVVVSSDVVWQDTGIALNIGDALKVSATGSWTTDVNLEPNTGPDGYTQQSPDNFLNLTDIGSCSSCASTQTPHWGALIGYIGNNPPTAGSYTSPSILPEAQKVFLVGSSFGVSIARAGELWLNINDNAYSANTGDNAGQVTATITDTTNTISVMVQKVWTADGKNNTKSSFAPGDTIHYMVSVKNSGSSTVTATFNFLATGPKQIFHWSGPGNVAPGTESFYSPSTVPTNAPGGNYRLTATVTYNGVSSGGSSQFKVASSGTWCQCTKYVANYYHLPSTYPNAKDWWSSGYLSKAGWVTDSGLSVGDIVVFQPDAPGVDSAGHVGIIINVTKNGNNQWIITMDSANWAAGTPVGPPTSAGCTNVTRAPYHYTKGEDIAFYTKG